VPEAFRKFAKGKREWADVVALLAAGAPNEKPLTARTNPQGCRLPSRQARHALQHWPGKTGHATLRDRATYGNPIDFRGMRHEPLNEQGVVLLFGMLAKELGYMIKAAQTGFPDCEAKRRIAPERWQRVRIEFEFESRNFRDHGHPSTGCDVIVCWRHNWDERPENIEVVELSSVIQSLANSDD
jgi:hypothetical protein